PPVRSCRWYCCSSRPWSCSLLMLETMAAGFQEACRQGSRPPSGEYGGPDDSVLLAANASRCSDPCGLPGCCPDVDRGRDRLGLAAAGLVDSGRRGPLPACPADPARAFPT